MYVCVHAYVSVIVLHNIIQTALLTKVRNEFIIGS